MDLIEWKWNISWKMKVLAYFSYEKTSNRRDNNTLSSGKYVCVQFVGDFIESLLSHEKIITIIQNLFYSQNHSNYL